MQLFLVSFLFAQCLPVDSLVFTCLFVCVSCWSRYRGGAYPGVPAANGPAGASVIPAAGGHHQEYGHEDEDTGRPPSTQLQGTQVR